MKELLNKSIKELTTLIANREVKAEEVTSIHLEHTKSLDKDLQAFNCLSEELAITQARRIDALVEAGKDLPALAGVPVALKDNICHPAAPTTCSSKILANFIPPYSATVARKLEEAGAVFLGKTNLDEFAMGSSTENSAFRKTKNPFDLSCVPGGSSGGSASAVAACQVTVALGSDTGGSIRQPASFCGIAGMKPTYGTVSRFGLVAFASSLDQIGPFGRCVEDIGQTLDVIAGHDYRDSTSYSGNLPGFSKDLNKPVKGLRIGVIQELRQEGIAKDVSACIEEALQTFKSLGAEIHEVSLPALKHSLPVYYLIATAEASANLARYDGVRYGLRIKDAQDILSMYFQTRQEGFGDEVKRRIMLGTYALSSGYYEAYYKKAQQVRRLIKNEFDEQFKQVDLLISPTSPSVAFKLGDKTDDPLTMYLSDIATIPANLAGLPGISIPCGLGERNLPVGLQILGAPLHDQLVLQAAYAFEQATGFHKLRPSLIKDRIRS